MQASAAAAVYSAEEGDSAAAVLRQVVACAASRYEFELFSGAVASVASEAQAGSQSRLLALARAAGVWRSAPLAAVHEMVVRAPDGRARTFRFSTATADIPAQVWFAEPP